MQNFNFIRTLPSKIIGITKHRPSNYNTFNQNYGSQGYNFWDKLAGLCKPEELAGRYKPLEAYPIYANNLHKSYDRKRSHDYTDDDHLDAKRPLTMSHYLTNRNSFSEGGSSQKRLREKYDDEDHHEAKKRRFNDTYAIKEPSQYAHPHRKILESLFEPEITAEGWKKKKGKIEYHTEVCGKSFVECGDSVVDARENVAETALKKLCDFKRENIFWPEPLLPFQLNQEFADNIERMVKTKFDETMAHNLRYKAYKVLAGIVMTTHEMSLDNAKVVAIGTGTKCIPNINHDQNGTIIHDMHAEVLARRSFVRFLCQQLNALQKKKFSIFQFEGKQITLKSWVAFHLYVNTTPCGDARIFSLRGLNHVKMEAQMGCLREKKIGGTEPLTENSFRVGSMSCSDKIARWNVLGLQGSHLAKFIKPIYLESIVLGSRFNTTHLYRAIGGRLTESLTDLPSDYCLNRPFFEATSLIATDQNFSTTFSTDFGVCWNNGSDDENAPEILDLMTGLTFRGDASIISKRSFKNMFKCLEQKLPVPSDEGIAKYKKAKEQFCSALKRKNFGTWENIYSEAR